MKINKKLIIIICTALIFIFCSCGRESSKLYEVTKNTLSEENSGDEMNELSEVLELTDTVQNTEISETTSGEKKQTSDKIFVQITGAVNNPGVYGFEEQVRIFEAVENAGGLREDACSDAVNMARTIEDEMVIHIPTREEISENLYEIPELEENTEELKDDGKSIININTAGKDELMKLTGIGEAKAQAIISYREQNDGFKNIEELKNISGIKESVYEKIKDKIKV